MDRFLFEYILTHTLGGEHPGRNPIFWQQACDKNLHNACYNLHYLVAKECNKGQALMCAKQAWMIKNAMGVERDDKKVFKVASRTCELGHKEICVRIERGEFKYAE